MKNKLTTINTRNENEKTKKLEIIGAHINIQEKYTPINTKKLIPIFPPTKQNLERNCLMFNCREKR
jgi:hypothetical protein